MTTRKSGVTEQTIDTEAQKVNNTEEQRTDSVEQQEEDKPKKYLVRVSNNPGYCGVGAGGVQFANGQAIIESKRMAAWFREHEGYMVTEQ